MIYIYDILVNFCDNDLIYDFYEWNDNDNIENIKKIKLVRIDSKTFDDLLNYDCVVDSDFLLKIYRTSEVYERKKAKVLDYAILISDSNRVIALEFDKKGSIIYKSKLLMDEEEEIAMLASGLEKVNFEYKKGKKILKNRYFTRKELIIKNFLYKEIESSYKTKKYDKLNFLYQEYFDKENDSIKNIKDELINSIKDKIDDKHKELFKLLKLIKKQV